MYDTRDKLVETRDGAQVTARFQYDHAGRRTLKIGDDGLIQSVYDGTSVLEELNDTGAQTAKYEWGSDRLISLARTNEPRRYYAFDGLGSVVGLTDDTGTVVAAYHLDAWGNYRNPAELTASRNRYGFTGYQWDAEAKLYYAKARYFDPNFGRFLTQDTYLGQIDNPPSLHRYFYANANPLRYVDPTGHFSWEGAKNVGRTLKGYGEGLLGFAGDAFVGTVEFAVKGALAIQPFNERVRRQAREDVGQDLASAGQQLKENLLITGGAIRNPSAVPDAIAELGPQALDAIQELGPEASGKVIGHTTGGVVSTVAAAQALPAIVRSSVGVAQRTAARISGVGRAGRATLAEGGATGGGFEGTIVEDPAPAAPSRGFAVGERMPNGRIAGEGPGAALRSGPEFTSRSSAFREAKRDLGIPMGQQAEAVRRVPLTDQAGRQILGVNGRPVTTREYVFTRQDGSKVLIQEHSAGHQFGQGGVGDQGPHFNVRPHDRPRTGKVRGAEEHYPLKEQ